MHKKALEISPLAAIPTKASTCAQKIHHFISDMISQECLNVLIEIAQLSIIG